MLLEYRAWLVILSVVSLLHGTDAWAWSIQSRIGSVSSSKGLAVGRVRGGLTLHAEAHPAGSSPGAAPGPLHDAPPPGAGEGLEADAEDLPKPSSLLQHLIHDVLLAPRCRGLFLTDLALYFVSAAAVSFLLLQFFLHPDLVHIKFKALMGSCLAALIVTTSMISTFINAGILLRLSDRPASGVLSRKADLLGLAVVMSVFKILVVALNQLAPLMGTVVVPRVTRAISTRRKSVGFVEQLDVVLTIMLTEGLAYPAAKRRACEYFLQRWGEVPMRSVKADKAFLLVALGLVFGVILPLLVVGAKTGIVVFKGVALTIFVVVYTALQLLTPLSANVCVGRVPLHRGG